MMTKSLHFTFAFLILSAAFALVPSTIVFATDGVEQSEIQTPSRCEQFLLSTKKIAAWPVKWAKTNWLEFRAEVKQDGAIRYVLAPRVPPERFHGLVAFMDPLIDLPIEVYSFVKHRMFGKAPVKKRLSAFTALPIGLLAWTLIFHSADSYVTDLSITNLEKAVASQRYGAEYVSEWILAGALSPKDAIKILKNSESEFRSDLAPVRDRIQQFQQQGIWSPNQAQAVNVILNRLIEKHKPVEIASNNGLAKYLKDEPAFQHLAETLPPEFRYTLDLLTTPTVEQFGKPDSHWLALFFNKSLRTSLSAEQLRGVESIDDLYKFHSEHLTPTAISHLVSRTIGDTKGMAAKLKKAKKYGFTSQSNFQYRSDMPIFASAIVFHDLESDLDIEDELDMWKLIFNDPRFSSFRKSFESKSASEFTVLLEAHVHAKAIGEVHLLNRKYKLSVPADEICKLIHGDGKSNGNPLFSGLREPMIPIQHHPGLAWIKLEVGSLYYQTFLTASLVKTEEALMNHYQKAFQQEQNIVKEAIATSGAYLAEKYKNTPECR